MQVEEQPPELVPSLSSHSSLPTLNPSLHTGSQPSFVAITVNPTEQVEQISLLNGDPCTQK